MTATIAESAGKFVKYLQDVSRIPPPWTLLYLSVAECLAVLDETKHIALMDLNGIPTPVSYGAGVPEVGKFYAVYQTREGDRWIKILSLAWTKRWTDSPASIIPADGYPYGPTAGLPTFMTSYAGIDYADVYLSGLFAVDADNVARYGLAKPTTDLTAPSAHPRIDKLVIDTSTGIVSWVTGVEAATPQVPATPAGKFEMGRVRLTPSTTVIEAQVDATAVNQGYVMTDTRKDPLVNTLFLPISFNQPGAKFSGLMRKPSRLNRLELRPVSLFGDGRDGVGTALTATNYDLATDSLCGRASGDCAYVAATAFALTADGRPSLAPAPTGVAAGDQVCGYVARAKENGDAGNIGWTYIGVVEEVSGGACILEADPDYSPVGSMTNYFGFVIRVPQYSSLELQTNSRVWVTPWEDGGPGLIPIKTWSFEGAGRIAMTGAGCMGGDYSTTPGSSVADLTYDSVTCRRHEGQGLKDKVAADIGDGVGMYGGGDGSTSDANFSTCVSEQGSGGAGGGWGYGGWANSGTGLQVDGYGEGGAHNIGGGVFVTTGSGAGGERGALSAAAGPGLLNPGWHAQSGYLYLGGGGGVGHVAFSHVDTGAAGGNGGGCAAIFAREGSPLIDADGALGHRGTAGLGMGAGGGGGGCVFVCQEVASDPRGNAAGQQGGTAWVDAFHHDGKGGNGGNGANHLARTSRISGLFVPTEYESALGAFPTTGGWLSEPVDLGRPRRPEFISADWALDGSDNIPPRFYLIGARDAQFTDGVVIYPTPTDWWEAGDALYPIVDGVELDVTNVVTERRRWWRKGVDLDTGTVDPYDTPLVLAMEMRGRR